MGKRKLSIIGFVSSESGEKLKIFRSPSFSENKLKNGVTTDLLKEESHRLVSEKKTISAQGNTKTSVQKERIARCVKKEKNSNRKMLVVPRDFSGQTFLEYLWCDHSIDLRPRWRK